MQGGEYRKIFERRVDELCKTGYNETFKPYFEDFQAVQTPPVPWKACPYPKGVYEMKNYHIEDYGGLIPPYVPGGEKWQMQVRYILDSEFIGGFNAFLTLRSEKSLLEG
jgi:hypothetical protein